MGNSLKLKIEILSYWHCGSGLGGGPGADALVIKDAAGLPFVPGRTLKGLLREAMLTAEEHKAVEDGTTNTLFGLPGAAPAKLFDTLAFSDAVLPEAEKNWLSESAQASQRAALFDRFASTALDENGAAADSSLRTVELCVPVTLEAVVEGVGEKWQEPVKKACGLLRHLGKNRNRGLGRCRVTVG